jgi:hypothetical protein
MATVPFEQLEVYRLAESVADRVWDIRLSPFHRPRRPK